MLTLSNQRHLIREGVATLVSMAFPYWSTNMVRYAVAVFYEEVEDAEMKSMVYNIIIGKYDGHELLPNDSGLPDLRN